MDDYDWHHERINENDGAFSRKAMALGLVNALIMAYVLGYYVVALGAIGVVEALMLAFWTWLGFVATTQISGFLWEGKPIKLFLLNTAYSLVTYSVMALILVLWW